MAITSKLTLPDNTSDFCRRSNTRTTDLPVTPVSFQALRPSLESLVLLGGGVTRPAIPLARTDLPPQQELDVTQRTVRLDKPALD